MKRTLAMVIAAGACLVLLPGCKREQQEAEQIPIANSVTCGQEKDLMEKAVEMYYALEGHNPANEAALVPMYLREQSKLMDLDANANVIPAPGSGC